ncbi:MAG TPA: hypothetical protein VFE58_02435 [Tepidisphaeraceae bacterium]|jgi:protein-S-isoprenylcysteine O-methyltransferase Ste14|nr:hypothetical protein [Tepidisphaeraceae bacterium]
MRDWTKGELQAFSAVAKLLIFIGLFAAIFQAWDGQYLWAAVGALAAIVGLWLGIWLIRYQKRTGKSAKPFAK